MNLLEKLIERSGEKWMPRKPDENGNRHFIGAVAYTSDFRRIEQLPRRDWTIEPTATEIQELMTRELKLPDGTMELWKVQAVALAEIAELRGAFCPVGVGMGKSLVSLLASVVLDVKRPLLLVPAALRDQTLLYVIPEMRKHWRLHPDLQVRGYSEISLEKNKDLLDELSPDLIIFDECHYLKNKSAGRTKRVLRFLREHPDVWCVALSGTIASRSLKDWSHISQWTLRDGSPVPSKWQELSEWAEALDADVPEEQRFLPGALKKFCEEDESAASRIPAASGRDARSNRDQGKRSQLFAGDSGAKSGRPPGRASGFGKIANELGNAERRSVDKCHRCMAPRERIGAGFLVCVDGSASTRLDGSAAGMETLCARNPETQSQRIGYGITGLERIKKDAARGMERLERYQGFFCSSFRAALDL